MGPTAAAAASAPDPISRVVELSNAERTKVGLPPLAVSDELAASAGWYAQVLAATDCFAHTCGPVPNLEDRCAMTGYPQTTMLGENVAAARPTPEEVVRDWMASPDHRANILHPAFTEFGVGLATGGRWGTYWVQNFGTRA